MTLGMERKIRTREESFNFDKHMSCACRQVGEEKTQRKNQC